MINLYLSSPSIKKSRGIAAGSVLITVHTSIHLFFLYFRCTFSPGWITLSENAILCSGVGERGERGGIKPICISAHRHSAAIRLPAIRAHSITRLYLYPPPSPLSLTLILSSSFLSFFICGLSILLVPSLIPSFVPSVSPHSSPYSFSRCPLTHPLTCSLCVPSLIPSLVPSASPRSSLRSSPLLPLTRCLGVPSLVPLLVFFRILLLIPSLILLLVPSTSSRSSPRLSPCSSPRSSPRSSPC